MKSLTKWLWAMLFSAGFTIPPLIIGMLGFYFPEINKLLERTFGYGVESDPKSMVFKAFFVWGIGVLVFRLILRKEQNNDGES